MLVVRGIDPEAFKTFDLQKRRTLADVITADKRLANDESARVVASAIGFAASYQKNHRFRASLCAEDERLEVFYEHAEGLRHCAQLYKVKNQLRINGGLLAATHYFCALKDEAKAAEFHAQVVRGEILVADDPAWRLREWVDRKMGVKRTAKNLDQFGLLLVKAWNMFRRGEKCEGPLRPPLVAMAIE